MRAGRSIETGATGRHDAARFGLIDAYRGAAILSVLIYHFTVCYQDLAQSAEIHGFAGHYPDWLRAGRYGVHLFFVISGLVITMTLLRSKGALDFARKRFSRIYPAFAVAVLLSAACVAVTNVADSEIGPADVLANLTMLSPHLGRPWVDPAYWSLLVEAKFYVVVCLSYALLKRRFWMGAVGYALVAAAVAHWHPYQAHNLLIGDEMPYFLIGIGGWLAFFEGRRGAAAVCWAAAAALYGYYNLAFGPACTLMRVCIAGQPAWIANAWLGAGVLSMLGLLAIGVRDGVAPMVWLGRISYSVYLIHQMFGRAVIRVLVEQGAPDLAAIGAAIAFALIAGWLMFNVVEQPGQRLVSRLLAGARPRALPAGDVSAAGA